MKKEEISNGVKSATKWSIITQLCTKLISPIVNMILARIFTPEIFGIIATVTMVTTFADIFTDAGFQQYLIQHKFKDNDEKNQYTNVAFWTNLSISLTLWLIIIIFRNNIANLVGNNGLGHVISIACIQLPITSFSSIQIALYRRELNFKPLFIAQMTGAFIPLLVTIPLALLGASFWALIIGTLCGELVKALILTGKSQWRPQWFYKFHILKKMFSFSIWALLEAISLWLISWIDSFLISSYLNSYYLGLYKNSLSMVNSIMAIITASITPIMFSTLSKLQDNESEFKKFFLMSHRILAIIVLPIGVGVFFFRDFATNIILGKNWSEASIIVGVSAITLAIRIVTVSIYSDVYRSLGKPNICLWLQVIDLVLIVPTCLISLEYGFWCFVFARAIIRFDLIIPHLIVMKKICRFRISDIIYNLIKPTIYSCAMGILAYCLNLISSVYIWSIISVLLCALFYVILIFIFSREDFNKIISLINEKKDKKC